MIRPATEADAAAIARMHTRSRRRGYQDILAPEVLDDSESARAERWRASLTEPDPPGMVTLVEDVEGDIAGVVSFGPSRPRFAPPGIGEVHGLYVDPTAQGAGVGTRLLTAAEDGLRAQGFDRATLWVYRDNAHARHFYEARGWAVEPGSEADQGADWHAPSIRHGRTL